MVMTLSNSKKEIVRSLMGYSTVGIEMGLCVAIGIALGYFLDKRFDTYPYLSIVCMIFGVLAAFKTIFVLLKKIEKENERDQRG
jgi:ATP synthase protein I